MFKPTDVGEIIATREYLLDGAKKVTVLIGKPQPHASDKQWVDWYCPFQKRGLDSDRVKRAWGVDPIQALLLALQMLGAELYSSEEYKTGRLTWHCERVKGDLGLPVMEIIRDVLPKGAGV